MPLPRLFGYRATCDRAHRSPACADPRCHIRASFVRHVRMNQLLSSVAETSSINILSTLCGDQVRAIEDILDMIAMAPIGLPGED